MSRIAGTIGTALLLAPGRSQLDATPGTRSRNALGMADAAFCQHGIPAVPLAAMRWRLLRDVQSLPALRERLQSMARSVKGAERLSGAQIAALAEAAVMCEHYPQVTLIAIRQSCEIGETDWRYGGRPVFAAMVQHLGDEFVVAQSHFGSRLRDPDAP